MRRQETSVAMGKHPQNIASATAFGQPSLFDGVSRLDPDFVETSRRMRGAPQTTHFQQPAGGVTLNRINPSQGASQIYGRLTATGQIILVNPAGFYFGPGSFVNVGGIIASTANITDADFLNNYYHFSNSSSFNGAIVNQGQIIAAEKAVTFGVVATAAGLKGDRSSASSSACRRYFR